LCTQVRPDILNQCTLVLVDQQVKEAMR